MEPPLMMIRSAAKGAGGIGDNAAGIAKGQCADAVLDEVLDVRAGQTASDGGIARAANGYGFACR
jgi:hypothetical protein